VSVTPILTQVFDLLLALAVVWTAWRALTASDLFTAVVLFIALGLLVAVVWARLRAPDVALAEAAIGAGLTGALLLSAFGRARDAAAVPAPTNGETDAGRVGPADSPPPARRVALALGAALVTAALGAAVWSLVGGSPAAAKPGLTDAVVARLPESGVTNPVTAVLLNFRGYDTLLEVAVLLSALLGVWALGAAAPSRRVPAGPVLLAAVRLLVPVMVVVAGYLLWVGAHAPGGAFQAGAVLAAAAVLLLLAGFRLPPARTASWLRPALAAGVGVFIVVAGAVMVTEGRLLEYPRGAAGQLILLIEAAATVSIGVLLAALFVGGEPGMEDDGARGGARPRRDEERAVS